MIGKMLGIRIGKMGRAEALAAVALVIGARQEPVAALRRMAAEDPALSVLGALAQRCAAGMALPDALVASGLLAHAEAVHLSGLPPALMADELTRLAQRTVHVPTGEVLARWLPLWALLAATIPSLLLGAVVAVIGGALYGGIWHTLGMRSPTHGPAIWWGVQVAEVVTAALIVAGLWSLLRMIPYVRRITVFSMRLEKAVAVAELVRSARAGINSLPLFTAWAQRSGDPAAIRAALAACGGDVTATLMKLGVVSATVDGRPDWDRAIAETAHHRLHAAQTLAPWLLAITIFAGVYGFMSWEVDPVKGLLNLFFGFETLFYWVGNQPSQFKVITAQIFALIQMAGCAVLIAHMFLGFGWLMRWLSGPASDVQMVADRMARALDRRFDFDQILTGLRLTVEGPMRRRINAALALTDETHPGARLVKAGIIPQVQAQALSTAEGADLPALLRSMSQSPNDYGLRAASSHAKCMLLIAVGLMMVQFYLFVGVIPKFKIMFDYMNMNYAGHMQLAEWAVGLSMTMLILAAVGSAVVTWGNRRGWWIAGGSWSRLANGLVLRRMLAVGADEAALARSLSAISPGLSVRLASAAERGDLPELCAVAGWSVRSPAELEQALAAELIRRDRRRARLALTARLLLPFLVSLPVSLTAVCISLTLGRIRDAQIQMAASHSGGGNFNGGTASMAMIHWWSLRCEAQGDAVVEHIRAGAQPKPHAQSPGVLP